jgi:homoserine kinase
VIVRVPASSANLGPGFDCLGMALSLHLELRVEPFAGEGPTEEGHPAVKAFRRLGGEGPVYVRSPIPAGRGLGFSGAARVAGLVAAHLQREGSGLDLAAVAPEVLAHASELEGHADNAAASLYGGVVVAAAGRAARVPLALDPAVVVWVPPFSTSTDESRTTLATTVALRDAVFNIGRTALLVTALATGDTGLLAVATDDRLHQDVRFERAPASRAALDAGLRSGAWCGWLSGSGPAIALLCSSRQAEEIAAALPGEGHTKMLRIDHEGATLLA